MQSCRRNKPAPVCRRSSAISAKAVAPVFMHCCFLGFVCGWLWEFWNYWAAAKWHYIFPMFQQWKIFEMPIPGYLEFLPFALECFAMYVTAAWSLRLLKRQPHGEG